MVYVLNVKNVVLNIHKKNVKTKNIDKQKVSIISNVIKLIKKKLNYNLHNGNRI